MFWTGTGRMKFRTVFGGSFSEIKFWTKPLFPSPTLLGKGINFWTPFPFFPVNSHLCVLSVQMFISESPGLYS
jgi:hypothetical protein